ncbi:hypothetical protein LguiA_029924 [Lonicera macranthoides]
MALGGTLSLFQLAVAEYGASKRLLVWTMKEDDETEEWIMQMDVNASFLFFGNTQFLRAVCLMRNGKILMLFNKQLKRFRSEMVKKLVFYDAGRNKHYFRIRGISRSYCFLFPQLAAKFLAPNPLIMYIFWTKWNKSVSKGPYLHHSSSTLLVQLFHSNIAFLSLPVKIKQEDELQTILTKKFLRFLSMRAEAFQVLRRKPV